MGSVIDYKKCPQCGGVVYVEYYYRSGEENEVCLRCGRWAEVRLPMNDEELAQLPEGNRFLVSKGEGLGRCAIAFEGGVSRSFSLGEPYSEEIEKWYMEAMKDENVDPEKSYLTRWDAETGQLVVVHGKDPGLYDDEIDEAEDEE